MPEWGGLGKALIVTGGLLTLAGVVILLIEKGAGSGGPLGEWLGWFGKLPGDISVKRDGFSFYFPLTTSILISIVLSLLVYFMSKR
jgi:formate hydrogenlyase subunit 3/multisubunit Na+/H+ antiporter MnhD subunit